MNHPSSPRAPKYPEQRDEIAKIMSRLRISNWEDLAARIPAWDRETVRKAAQGSQKASRQFMAALRDLLSFAQERKYTSGQTPSGMADAQRFGMLLTEEEREGLLYMVRDKTDEEIIQQINKALTDKALKKTARFAAVRLWTEVLERRAED
jgi:hypothetical protein